MKIIFQKYLMPGLVFTAAIIGGGYSERVAALYQARGNTMPRSFRPAISITVMAFSVFAASAIGLADLIAKGYGALTLVQ